MIDMTVEQRKAWAEDVIKYAPHRGFYVGVSRREAELRISALTVAAAKVGCWSFLAQHLALIHDELLRQSKS